MHQFESADPVHDPGIKGLQFHFIKWLKNGYLKSWHFEGSEDIKTNFK